MKRIIVVMLIVLCFQGIAFAEDSRLTLSSYVAMPGDSVIISGTAYKDTWVTVKVLNSAKDILFFDAVLSDSSGSYTVTLRVPNVPNDTLTITSGCKGISSSKTLTVTNRAHRPPAETAPYYPVTGIKLNMNLSSIKAGEEQKLMPQIEPFYASNKKLTWSSGNSLAASVDNNGVIKGIAPGKAKITAAAENGRCTASLIVNVVEESMKIWNLESSVPSSKKWVVKFNKPVDELKLNENNIYITDEDNNVIKSNLKISEDRQSVTIIPEKDFEKGKAYSLWIKNVVSSDGKLLKENIVMDFFVEN